MIFEVSQINMAAPSVWYNAIGTVTQIILALCGLKYLRGERREARKI